MLLNRSINCYQIRESEREASKEKSCYNNEKKFSKIFQNYLKAFTLQMKLFRFL